MPEIDYQTICNNFLMVLPSRSNEVLSSRFGLNGKAPETLQSIGNDLGITRERVRQLEKSGFLKLQDLKADKNLQKVFSYFEKYLQEKGGLKREDILLCDLGNETNRNFVYFLLVLADMFHRCGDNEELYPFWAQEKKQESVVLSLVKKVKDLFQKEKRPLRFEDLSIESPDCSPVFLSACLEIAKAVEQGPLGNFGLVSWPEVKPRGVRDAAYLVLKKIGQPLHFREIAQTANTLPGELFTKRKMLPQTIHNELIRDPRFVLVGRGLYGLNEWGYTPGTVKDVIFKVLEASSPLSKVEVLKEVQKKRVVKPNTVFLNLSDKNCFSKDQSGKYALKIKTA